MLSLRPPSDQTVFEWMARLGEPCTRDDAIPNPAPPGTRRNAGQVAVGHGERCYDAARRRVLMWETAPGGWCRFVADGRARVGQRVAVVARVLGLAVTNACEVVGVRTFESGDWSVTAVTYATLPGHDMTGAEQFRVSWDRTTDVVTYDIASYARPQSWLGWLGLPYVRHLQRRFVAESMAEMVAVCADETPARRERMAAG